MQLSLSDSNFALLLKMSYLGEIMLNDWTRDGEWEDDQRASADLLLDLCAKASEGPDAYLVERDLRSGEWVPSAAMRKEMEPFIKQYDEEVFWDELVHKLARRDLLREYGEDANYISEAHFARAEDAILSYYNDEVDTHGIDRITVQEGG